MGDTEYLYVFGQQHQYKKKSLNGQKQTEKDRNGQKRKDTNRNRKKWTETDKKQQKKTETDKIVMCHVSCVKCHV